MTDKWKTRVESATVRLPDLGGLGVLIPGDFIGTACHCVDWVGTGMMALGMEYPANVVTADGTKFRLGVAAADPVSDMAVLTGLDHPDADADCEAFEEWRERVEPISLSQLMLRWQESCPVFVLTHKGKWIGGTVTRYSLPNQPMPSRVVVHTEEQIECGTSGGPVVTEDGQLVGIVSASGGDSTELMPVAHLALPRWVLDKMVWVPDEEEMNRVRGIFAQAAARVKVRGKRKGVA
jgi:trypsin-like peptidase